jgi:hypothetical protein
MWKPIFAVMVVSVVGGCVTTDGPYSVIAPSQREHAAQVASHQRAKPTQTARAPQRQRIQVSLQQRALGPLVHKAEYPVVLGVAF